MVNRTTTPENEKHSPYSEPIPSKNEWPTEWTPHQKEVWTQSGQKVYENLETELGRYWYRRTWRPKKRGSGMMKCDHVKLGTPEDYVEEHVSDTLSPMGDVTSVMMRELASYSVDTGDLDDAVDDIVQAKVSAMSDEQKQRLAEGARQLARAYGLDQEGVGGT